MKLFHGLDLTVENNSHTLNLTKEDFARYFGTTVEELSSDCKKYIRKLDFRYNFANQGDREVLLLRAIKTVDFQKLTASGEHRKFEWEKGWSENLKEFTETNDITRLIPKFVKKDGVIRLGGNYILPKSPEFETSFVTVLRCYLFNKYFKDMGSVFEFGCGTGLNLVALAKLFPEKELYGLDWAEASIKILHQLRNEYGYNLQGRLFDMFQPDETLKLPENSGVYTIGAMEQLGLNFEGFLQYLLKQQIKTCVNIETIYELYDQDNLFDYVAARYLKQRNYLQNYYTRLQELEKKNVIEILKVQRTFGSYFHDGYTYIVWRLRNEK